MSTDALQAPFLEPLAPVGYALIPHINSNRSRRNGSAFAAIQKGLRHTTVQTIRHPEGGPLPHRLTPALVRSTKSKHKPHVGAKQLSKLS